MRKLAFVFALALAVSSCGEQKPAQTTDGTQQQAQTEQSGNPSAAQPETPACACPEGECKCDTTANCGAGCGTEKKEACASAADCCTDNKEACSEGTSCGDKPAK